MSNLPTPHEAHTVPTPHQVLDLALPGHGTTVRGYLIELLRTLWREADGFSAKRALGEEYWPFVVYDEMVKAGWVTGLINEEGYADSVDTATADQYVDEAILLLASDCRLFGCEHE